MNVVSIKNPEFEIYFTQVQRAMHQISIDHGFYEGYEFNIGEKIALMHSELSEALEFARKDPSAKSDKIPEFTGIEEEFADLVIRVMDTAQKMNLRLASAIIAKAEFNNNRPYKHGKKF